MNWRHLLGLAIAAALVAAVLPRVVRGQEPIACEGEVCVVAKAYLAELVRQARRVEEYAFMCGWTKEGADGTEAEAR